ncbi:MAG TPA: aspartate aminotransferase family protein [Polyangiaceae bacterium]|jgi:acetylornithine/N-succinyldiaminopimelate aminotransferase
MSAASLIQTGQRYLYPNYRQPPIVFTHGQGCQLWDDSGKRYLDMFAGIAVSTLGHGHPKLVAAIAEQARKLIHVSNYYYNEPNLKLAERVCHLAGMDRAFFCNSGTEAIEATLKLARRYFHTKGQIERTRVIAFHNSFHGRTLGALAATGQPKYKDGFGPLLGVTHVDYGDAAAVDHAMGADVAGILVEPVQGEGGVLPAPAGFLRDLRTIADRHGALLLADEVQTGVGRTGKFLAFHHEGVEPDVVALAKALGGGVPIGAMLCKKFLEEALPPGSHGSTFGGNPLASAAALCVLAALESDGLMSAAVASGEILAELLRRAAQKFPRLVETSRGRGLLQALVLREGIDSRKVLGVLQDSGVLVTVAGGQALRFSPPLIVSQAELEEACGLLERALSSYSA